MADYGHIVLDGAVDPDRFARVSTRIVWLLRDANDPEGTLTDLRIGLKQFADEKLIAAEWKKTFCAVARVSYGLLHRTEAWDAWCDDEQLYSAALGDIAVVNIKKNAGGSQADWQELQSAFATGEQHLRAQLNSLRPQVVIGGNVMWLLRHWCGSWEPRFPSVDEPYDARLADGVAWIHAHHPNQHTWSHRTYFERIAGGLARAQLG